MGNIFTEHSVEDQQIETKNRSIWPVGMIWTATIAAVGSFMWQGPAQGTEPLKLSDFSQIENVSLSPDVAYATGEQRPVQRGARSAAGVDSLDTYRFWSDAQLASMYEGYWFEAQSVQTRDEVNVLADRMSALWQVLGERSLQSKVRAPDLQSVSWFLHETGTGVLSSEN